MTPPPPTLPNDREDREDRESLEDAEGDALQRVVVSACLLGEMVRYDGTDRRCTHPILARWMAQGRVVAVCPELAGGLPVPRAAAEIEGGAGGSRVLNGVARVVDCRGTDFTAPFVAGARRILALAREHGARVALLKAGSPSCGSGYTYDGSFTHRRVPLPGVACALLRDAGIAVFSEDAFERADLALARLDGA